MRHFSMAKEGVIARPFMLGVVQTSDGIPFYHEVFDGNSLQRFGKKAAQLLMLFDFVNICMKRKTLASQA